MSPAKARPPASTGLAASPKRIGVLDSVRGVAALVVLIHHCLLTQPDFSDFFFSNWRTGVHSTFEWLMFYTPIRLIWAGSEAVILFYVLSGVVLALPWVDRRPPSYPSYVVKRVCRIYIPYCVAIAGAAILNQSLQSLAVAPGASEWLNTMTWSTPVTAPSLADHALMIGHYNSINGVIHTLIWEMRVSLVFPFMLLPIVRWRLKGALLVAALLAVLVAVLQLAFGGDSLAFNLIHRSAALSRAGKLAFEAQWTAYYALLFVIGSLLALNLRTLQTAISSRLSIVLLVVGLLMVQAHWSQLQVPQDLLVGFGAAIVICSTLPNGPIHSALSHRWLRWLGRISYSLYLVHVPILLTAVLLLRNWLPMPVILIPTAMLCLPAGWAFHVLVAAPSAKLGKHLAERSWFTRIDTRRAAAAVAGLSNARKVEPR